MATEAESRPLDDVQPDTNIDIDAQIHDRQNTPEKQETLKRKVSADEEEGSAKRIRQDDHFREATDERPRRGSSQSRRESHDNSAAIDADRRRLATQEERKRGKRLFGGLLSTLSQTTGSSQQKRRLEIERRQQERLKKQKVEDDRVRDENRARLTGIRMAEQIVFDEQVVCQGQKQSTCCHTDTNVGYRCRTNTPRCWRRPGTCGQRHIREYIISPGSLQKIKKAR